MTTKRAEQAKAAGKKGKDFLAANKKKKGVVTLKSGLQYLVLKQGTGKKPKATDRVKTHYHGTLIDGTVFDSSVQREMPATFPVNGVIKGWIEALQLMNVGSKWKLFIPSELAYGKRGSPPKIAPDSVLIFEIELLGIE
ncbi:MAG: FKBP-type peptidyl-prolyl cis-trans isomerase [Planctomycetes bacterium]|nr:FKBP-type peptidyl-prolyl cis-trans isomerase [Planctomycetota bacterium]